MGNKFVWFAIPVAITVVAVLLFCGVLLCINIRQRSLARRQRKELQMNNLESRNENVTAAAQPILEASSESPSSSSESGDEDEENQEQVSRLELPSPATVDLQDETVDNPVQQASRPVDSVSEYADGKQILKLSERIPACCAFSIPLGGFDIPEIII